LSETQVEKLTATIAALRDAAARLEQSAALLEAQGPWHLEHARAGAWLAISNAERAIRQIDRAQESRAATLLTHSTERQA
jgi:hypothetical protein